MEKQILRGILFAFIFIWLAAMFLFAFAYTAKYCNDLGMPYYHIEPRSR